MESPSGPDAQLRTRMRQQEVVADLGQRALEAEDLEGLMHDAAEVVAETLENEYATVLELLPDGEEVLLRQGAGWQDDLVGEATVPTDPDSQAGYTLVSAEPIIVDDLRTEERFSGPDLLTDHGVVSGISVIVGSVDEPWGVLGTHTTERREFTEHDATFVQSVANVLAAAIDRADKDRRLRERERRLERYKEYTDDVLTAVDDMFYVVDRAGTFQRWNETLPAVTGYADREIETMQPLEFVAEADREELAEGIAEVFETGHARVTADVLTKEGDRIPYEFVASKLTNPEGDAVLAGIGRNVSDRKERTRELAKYQQIVETINDGIYVVDEDGHFTTVNEAYAELTGYDREELLGSHATDVVDEETLDRAEALRDEMADEDAVPTLEATVETADKEDIPAEATFATLQTDEGSKRVGVVRDVSERKRMEQEIRESERKFRQLTEHLEEVVWLATADQRDVLYANPAFEDVWGIDRDALYDDVEVFFESIHPDDRDRVREEFTGPRGAVYDVDYRIVRPDGDVRWINDRAIPIVDDDGDVSRVVGNASDITERKERELELERYETIVETIGDAIYVVDDDQRFTMVNETAVEMAGYAREELLGMEASEVVGDEAAARVAALGESLSAEDREVASAELTLTTADGEEVPLEVRFTPLRTGDDGTERVGVARDISERKERERALEESERRYRTLVENFPGGAVGLFDEDLRYTAVGGQLLEADDVDPEDRIGHSILEIYPDEIVAEVEPHFHAALEGEARTFETEYRDRHLLANTVPVRNAVDDVYAGMLVVQDVTERREYRRQLEESNERLEQFAYAASHDLQEPLRMVSSYLQLLESRYGDQFDDDAEEFLDYAVDGAERMREMIEGLLQYSRVDSRGDPLEPVDLEAVFDASLDDLEVRIAESDADIAAEPLPTVRGDESQLRQVFQNLLQNAIEYAGEEPPRIRVEAERTGGMHRISVHDEGIGIDAGDRERIFEVFQRLHSREEHPGTGIGLALCRRIVERHGGEIWVDSEPGEGATFSFTLPAVS